MFQTKIILTFGILAILNITNNLQQAYGAFLPTFDEDSVPKSDLEKNRPIITWPDNFEIGISTNEFGLNVTEKIYFDKNNQRLRIQLFYSVMGLDSSKGFDLVLDETKQTVAVQSDSECKKTDFRDSLLIVNLFFKMFNQLTDYEGLTNDGLHKFKFKQFDESVDSIKFYFYFDEKLKYVKSSVSQSTFGDLHVDVVEPLNVRSFTNQDWYNADCEQIENGILKSGNGWVSFMHELISHLFLKGQDIQAYLGLQNLLMPQKQQTQEDPDEDFSED